MHAIHVTEAEETAKQHAATLGVSYIDLHTFPIAQEALALIPEAQARAAKAICFLFTGDELRVASPQPTEEAVKNLAHELGERHHAKSALYLISEKGFNDAMAMYDRLPKMRHIATGVEISEADITRFAGVLTSFDALQKRVEGATISDLLVMTVAAALEGRASDVHVEAEEKNGVVRYRIDGYLHEVLKVPHEIVTKLTSRLKLVAGLKINITDTPQDGRFTITLKDEKIEVRVSTLPTAYGESVVMRLLRPTAVALDFDSLGIFGLACAQLKAQMERPNGMILTTGPTGSGKTTTLYAILQHLNKEDTKIITLEDPIEYKLKGISQSQIDPSKDFTFAKGLRSILRQDPDVVMVGEIRDFETADVAIQAALTGHIMLSTVHTNSASGAIPRFLSMGVKPFLLAPALNAVIGQRLIRRVCEKCKKETTPAAALLEKAKTVLATIPATHGYKDVDVGAPHFFVGAGCATCFNLGYKGRLGIYEVMIMNKEIEQVMLSENPSEYILQEIAVKQGMITMLQDGVLKAMSGLTSLEEVFAAAE